MALIALGVSHHTAPLSIRERLTFRAAELEETVRALRNDTGASEGVLLSTCNRTEVYLVEGEREAARIAWDALSQRANVDASTMGYVHRDRDAASHLFRVASGLDSMVLGESQIHGQVREAWEHCRDASGMVLNRLFQSSLSVAGRVRSETSLGHGAASISSAAVQLARQIFGSLRDTSAMVLGAGEMADLALACLTADGVRTTVVAGRTYGRARELAARHGARAAPLAECWAQLAGVDLLLCSTASPRPVVTLERLAPALAQRGDRPLCILDIAVPRDVDPAVRSLGNVFLYDLDDLQRVVSANIERRRGVLADAERLIAEEVERFWRWVVGLRAVPLLTRLRADMERIRLEELDAALRRFGDLTAAQRAELDRFSRALMNKFLHEPTIRLRGSGEDGNAADLIHATRRLFALDSDTSPSSPPAGEPPPPRRESRA